MGKAVHKLADQRAEAYAHKEAEFQYQALSLLEELGFVPAGSAAHMSRAGGYGGKGGQDKKLKVMVVDDSADIREFMTDILTRHHYQVVECADGKEALQAIAKHPDLALVFLDLIMPQITGTHFLKMIRKMDALSGVPIIVTSGNTTLKVIKELQALDVAGFLVKPISQDKILNSVEKLSKSKQQKSPPLKSSP